MELLAGTMREIKEGLLSWSIGIFPKRKNRVKQKVEARLPKVTLLLKRKVQKGNLSPERSFLTLENRFQATGYEAFYCIV